MRSSSTSTSLDRAATVELHLAETRPCADVTWTARRRRHLISTVSSCACISAILGLHLCALLHHLPEILHATSSPSLISSRQAFPHPPRPADGGARGASSRTARSAPGRSRARRAPWMLGRLAAHDGGSLSACSAGSGAPSRATTLTHRGARPAADSWPRRLWQVARRRLVHAQLYGGRARIDEMQCGPQIEQHRLGWCSNSATTSVKLCGSARVLGGARNRVRTPPSPAERHPHRCGRAPCASRPASPGPRGAHECAVAGRGRRPRGGVGSARPSLTALTICGLAQVGDIGEATSTISAACSARARPDFASPLRSICQLRASAGSTACGERQPAARGRPDRGRPRRTRHQLESA